MAVIEVLRNAGIHGEPDVRPASVVSWAGARLHQRGASIDQVARALGVRSSDRAAEMIGYEWQAHRDEPPL